LPCPIHPFGPLSATGLIRRRRALTRIMTGDFNFGVEIHHAFDPVRKFRPGGAWRLGSLLKR
jgi:hypothetical protein